MALPEIPNQEVYDPAQIPHWQPEQLHPKSIRGEKITPSEIQMLDQRLSVLAGSLTTAKVLHFPLMDESWKFKPETVAAMAATPVASDLESVDDVVRGIDSIEASAQELSLPTLVAVGLNYVIEDCRYGRPARRIQARRAREIGGVLWDRYANSEAVRLLVTVDELPEGKPHISAVRQHILQAIANYVHIGEIPVTPRDWRDRQKQKLFTLPLIWNDADTVLGKETLPVVSRALKESRSLFVSGNIRYEGELIQHSSHQLESHSVNERLTYFVEHLRRAMLNGLPPEQPRGYVPEAGLAMRFGTLLGLGGFNTRASSSESYWLLEAASRLVRGSAGALRHGPRSFETRKPVLPLDVNGSPFLPEELLLGLRSLVSYHDYQIDTSIRGTLQSVASYGRNALISFDQGPSYALWTDASRNTSAIQEPTMTNTELQTFLDAVYSYFRECGGRLDVEQLRSLHSMLSRLKIASDPWMWIPCAIPREQWPK